MSTRPPMTPLPFHAGETAVQERLGVRERVEPWAARVVRPFLTEQLREFFGQLPWIVAAARDAAGRPWVTLLAGAPGFTRSPDPETLLIAARTLPGDALDGALEAGADLGLLGIDLQTRRRNRVNGRLVGGDGSTLRLAVGQAFGNCPQYIVERSGYAVDAATRATTSRSGDALDAGAMNLIRGADTLFLGSGLEGDPGDPRFGLDASHRGGSPGFVQIADPRHLVIPDYAGNNHFNTLGNLALDPRVAVTFVDFEAGSVLQITGRAEIDFHVDDPGRFPGAQRLIHVHLERVVQLGDALPMRWHAPRGTVREYRVRERVRESADVISFHLVPRDPGPPPEFEPGQHLPLQLRVEGSDLPVKRSYSLSGGPGEDHLRISVKRDPLGLVSRALHEQLDVGAGLVAGPPAGDFAVAPGERPLVLLGAGIGITPLLSMLRGLVARGDPRPLLFAHGVRDGAHHPFAEEVRRLVDSHPRATSLVACSRPAGRDREGVDFDRAGRIDVDLLAGHLGHLDADFYLCGPPGFVAELSAALADRDVPEERIRIETF